MKGRTLLDVRPLLPSGPSCFDTLPTQSSIVILPFQKMQGEVECMTAGRRVGCGL